MSDIIISYQPQSNPAILEKLAQFLGDRFGEQFIRMGVENIPDNGLNIEIADADAFVLVIGPDWLDNEWLNDPRDLNYQALWLALQNPSVIVPVLIDGASMPSPSLLPMMLRNLPLLEPVTLSEENFREDATDLANRIARYVNEKRLHPHPRKAVTNPVASMWTQDEKPKNAQAETDPFEGPDPRRPFSGGATRSNTEGTYVDPLASPMPFFNALMYPFTTDRAWLPKIGIAMLLSFIPILGSFFVMGYGIRITHRLQDGKAGLPEWDQYSKDFSRGLIMTLGTIFHMLIIFVPLMVLGEMALRLGMTQTYSEEFGGIIQQPTLFGRTVGLILELIGAYFFVIINATAVVMYIKTDNYAMMWKFGPLLLEAMHNVGRNLIYIVNMMLFGVILLILFYIGSMFFIIPGMFALAAGNLGYFYLITYWMKKLENTPQG